MQVLVTGANGFIGRHVVMALQARGFAVRALVGPGAQGTPVPWAAPVDVVGADLSAGSSLEGLFRGIDCLVHLAAALGGTAAEQRAATVEGTRRLLEAMARTSTRRLLLASSFAVYDWSSIEGVLDERSPLLEPDSLVAHGPYAAAKWEQEHLTRQVSADQGWALTVLRPGFVWGRGREHPACLGLDLGPAFLVVGPRSQPCLSHVENCADLFAAAAADPRSAGRTFNVVDGHGVSSWRHTRNHSRLSGQHRIRVPFPYAVASGGVRLAHAALRPLAPHLPSALIPGRFHARFRPVRLGQLAARDILGWTPPWSYEEALRRTYGTMGERGGAADQVRPL